MRGNTWQITAIIAIILVVILIVPLVLMGRNHHTLSENEKQAQTAAKDAAQKAATLERENGILKTLISGADTPTLDTIQKQHAEAVAKALPDENDATRPYQDVLDTILRDLAQERENHKATQGKYAQRESDFNNAQNNYDKALASVRAELSQVQAAYNAAQARFLREKGQYDQRLNDAQTQQAATLARAERKEFELTARSNQLEISLRDLGDTNRSLNEMMEEVRNPNVEHPAGKIISVDQEAGLAYVNLGSADGLMVRTMFSVYHSSITGLTFRTTSVGEEAVYCDVCKRDITRDVSKASVEVTRILGPNRAEVRILDDVLTDPIMRGDIVYSPIWKPGQRLRFALTAGMHLPGAEIDSGTEAVKRLIEMNNGIVDCWIREIVPIGEDHLVGSISNLTNFIVVSEKTTRGDLDPEVIILQDALLADARNRAIKTISLDELLSRMAWRNVTPVAHFDSLEYKPESMRVVPSSPGSVRKSPGTVSPIFSPDNSAARVNALDANPVRTSPGTVSPVFDTSAPPPPSSAGSTSELFRPRSPSVGR